MSFIAQIKSHLPVRLHDEVDLIVAAFQARLESWVQDERLWAAAVVNAYAESALDEDATGDSGHAHGFWQANDHGAGKGRAEKDLDTATGCLDALMDDPAMARVRRLLERGDAYGHPANIPQLTWGWCRWVERPARAADADDRAKLAEKWLS